LEHLEDRAVPSFGFGWALHVGGTSYDQGYGIALDGGGNVYVTGYFNGTNVNFAPLNAAPYYLTSQNGGQDAFAAKYSAADGSLLWATDMGIGNGGRAIAVSGSSVYVSGAPFTYAGVSTALAQLDAGTGAVLHTVSSQALLSGSSFQVAVGPATGNVYVTGDASSSQAFVAKLDPSLNLLWTRATAGGAAQTGGLGNGVAVYDAPNNGPESVYLTGYYSGTTTFGTVTKTSVSGSNDVFVWKLNADGSTAAAAGLGSSGGDYGYGIAVDAAGSAYLTGAWNSGTQIVVAKLTPALAPSWTNYFSGVGHPTSNMDGEGFAVAVDAAEHVYTAGGFLGSFNFDPNGSYVLQSGQKGARMDAYVSELDANGDFVAVADLHNLPDKLGFQNTPGFGITLDASSPGAPNVYVTGSFAGTRDFNPNGGYPLTSNGYRDIFITKLTQPNPTKAAAVPAAVLLPGAQSQPTGAAAADGSNDPRTPMTPAARVIPLAPSADALPAWPGLAGPRRRPSALFADWLATAAADPM
jgi:hypothetical protein